MRIAGHTLLGDGRPYEWFLGRNEMYHADGPVGRAQCSCGEASELLPTTVARRRWHDQHKAEL